MRYIYPILNGVIALLLGSSLGLAVEEVSGHEIRIEVTGIEKIAGTLRARLDQGERAFKNDDPPFSTADIQVTAQTMTLVFKDVPPGSYAIKVIHDVNDDRILNGNLLGIPSEPYGISNNARAKFGLPAVEQATFSVGEHDIALAIRVAVHSMF